VWHELRQDLMSRLDTITLEDLCRQAHQLGIESDARRRADFAI
jgi:DNA-binding IscR family transcriptional regulator